MPVYFLGEEPLFPAVENAEPSGLLAVGGDLSSRRLVAAYRRGIFPWYSEGDPILWFSPDPREMIVPSRLRLDRGMRRSLRKASPFRLSLDRAFDEVIAACAAPRRAEDAGTWITGEMRDAYRRLHRLGYAHSAEAWLDGSLVGGVYGVAVGRCYSGESMFHRESGASVAALVSLIRQLERWDFTLFDCQMASRHLRRLGSEPWPRRRFMDVLSVAAAAEADRHGNWILDEDLSLLGGAGMRV